MKCKMKRLNKYHTKYMSRYYLTNLIRSFDNWIYVYKVYLFDITNTRSIAPYMECQKSMSRSKFWANGWNGHTQNVKEF